MKDYTLPSLNKVQRALARDFVDAFEKGDLAAAYEAASKVVPKLYPAKTELTPSDRQKAADLVADAFLLLGAH